MTESDENDLRRFVAAQGELCNGYDLALSEIRSGRKVSHWIWYIFPQLRGLGHSRLSFFYGLAGREEAEAYLQDDTLGPRLREISRALLSHAGKKTAKEILGYIDAMKVRSCMTLFDCISPGDVFAEVLETFYGGKRDRGSYERLVMND